jgi:hypothetical protein
MKKDDRVRLVPVTFKVVTALTPLNEAVMFTLPGATPVASPGLDFPADSMEAIAESEDDQVAEVVTTFMDPSLKPAVTLNCSVLPAVTDAAVGVTDIDVTVSLLFASGCVCANLTANTRTIAKSFAIV